MDRGGSITVRSRRSVMQQKVGNSGLDHACEDPAVPMRDEMVKSSCMIRMELLLSVSEGMGERFGWLKDITHKQKIFDGANGRRRFIYRWYYYEVGVPSQQAHSCSMGSTWKAKDRSRHLKAFEGATTNLLTQMLLTDDQAPSLRWNDPKY